MVNKLSIRHVRQARWLPPIVISILPKPNQRQRFVKLYLAALDAVGMPDDQPFREAVQEHVEFGSRVAMQNSHAERDEDLYPLHEVPRWHREGDQEVG